MVDERYGNPALGSEACRQFDREVAGYLDGENRPTVEVHAKECVFCGVVLEDLRAVIAESRDLALVDPPARVWANVRAALVAEGIIHEPEHSWSGWLRPLQLLWRPLPAAALAGLVVLAAALTVPHRVFVPAPTHTTSVKATRHETVALATIPSEDVRLAQTVDLLERDYQSRKTSLEPAVAASYEKGLASLDDSIREARVSVEEQPDNSLAREYLVGAYQQKAQVLSAALEYDAR